jgi:hypothetical protein
LTARRVVRVVGAFLKATLHAHRGHCARCGANAYGVPVALVQQCFVVARSEGMPYFAPTLEPGEWCCEVCAPADERHAVSSEMQGALL